MLKCLHCHNTFDEDEVLTWEEGHGFNWGPKEKFSSCPFCGGDYEEAEICDKCGEYYLEDELFNGVCAGCVVDSIDYSDFLEFLTENELLGTFMFKMVFESPEPPEYSEKLLAELRNIFLRKRLDDLTSSKAGFLELCKKFVTDNEFTSVPEYAEWLEYVEVK